jgi:RsiW-degrading membrane proteinase PrsW (M82 family)
LIGGVGAVCVAYLLLGSPESVSFGLLAGFFWWGGIGGAVTAAIGQLLSREVILEFFPECNLNTSHAGNSDAYCQLFLYVQIVFLAGFWEESFKAIWVFMRFKTKALWVHPGEDSLGLHTITDRVPRRTCCFFATATCTCWWRLAETPEAIFLSTMAAGAGFESIENILYMFRVVLSFEGE